MAKNNILSKGKQLKAEIKSQLGKGFKVNVSKNGLNVQLCHKYKDMDDWNDANAKVKKMAKALKLDEVGAGTMMDTKVRDWEFVNLEVEKSGMKAADKLMSDIRAFLKEYSNFAESDQICDKVDQMRQLLDTDEN